MNRNVESHFSMLPQANISRSRFDRSQDIKFTGNVGQLIPFFVDEVLPGDTFDITTSKVVRLQTLLTPPMDNIYLDTYWFFVPNRLVHTHFREIMGENNTSAWIPEVEYSVPQISLSKRGDGTGVVKTGDILDYMGVPVNIPATATDGDGNTLELNVNSYPFRAYWKIVDEFFRDENLVDPVNVQTGDSDQSYGVNIEDTDLDKPFVAAKYHDYFTSCLPGPQKGPAVSVPAGFTTNNGVGWPVATQNFWNYYGDTSNTDITDNSRAPMAFFKRSTGVDATDKFRFGFSTAQGVGDYSYLAASDNGLFPANLFASPASNQQTGLSIDINDLRYAFQLQKLYERDARGGTRYSELCKAHFGVTNPDARLQRPEYLGGNRIPISIHQVTNQSQGENEFLGDLGAMSLTTDKHRDFVKSFTEHGFVIGLCVARYDHSYPQGLNKMWSRKTRFDYYWPVFAMLGEQAVYKKEICATGTSSDDEVFGYQERWAEYRYAPNRVAGEMRPGITNTLDSWHFADNYTNVPTLSEGWIKEDKTNVDRVLAVTSSVSDQMLLDIYVKNFTTRPMPLYSIPGLIDHF